MSPTRRSTSVNDKKSDTATSSSKENNAPSVTRKRGRPQSKKVAEPVAAEEKVKQNDEKDVKVLDVSENKEGEEPVVKRKRGRPAKLNPDGTKKTVAKEVDPSIPKRGRGRPRKVVAE